MSEFDRKNPADVAQKASKDPFFQTVAQALLGPKYAPIVKGLLSATSFAYDEYKRDKINNPEEEEEELDYDPPKGYRLEGVDYTDEQLRNAAVKYDMEFTDYIGSMKKKGLVSLTSDDDKNIDNIADSIIARQKQEIYAPVENSDDVTNEDVVNDNGLLESKYELTSKGVARRLGSLTSDELKDQAKDLYNKLLEQDPYLNNFSQKILNANESLIKDYGLSLVKKYNVDDPSELKIAEKDMQQFQFNILQDAALKDEKYQNIMTRYSDVVNEKFNQTISEKLQLENRSEEIPDWLEGSDFGIGLYELKKRLSMGLNNQQVKSITTRISDYNNFLENVDSYKTKDGEYVLASSMQAPRSAGVINIRTNDREEAISIAKRKLAELKNERTAEFLDNQEMQESINLIGAPQFFGKDWDVDFDVDEYQQMMGTQVGQMALGLVSFGGSTYLQEFSGAYGEMTMYEASKLAFPDIVNDSKRAEAFYKLSNEEKAKFMGQALDMGLVDVAAAEKAGLGNAALDFAGNFVVFLKGTKAVKFLPKQFTRFAVQKKWAQFAKEGWKVFGKDIAIGVGTEVATELAQEVNSDYQVSKATGQTPGYYLQDEEGVRRYSETAIQTLLSTLTLVGGGKTVSGAYTIGKDQAADFMAKYDKGHVRNLVNSRKKYLKTLLDRGTYTLDQYNEKMAELEIAENVLKNTKNKYLKGKDLKQAYNNQIKIERLLKQQEDLKNDKDITGIDKTKATNSLNEDIKELLDANTKLRAAGIYKSTGKLFAKYINGNDGVFGGKSMRIFETVDQLKNYVSKRITGIKKSLKDKNISKEQKSTLEQELKELQSNTMNQFLKGNSYGVKIGNQAFALDDRVDNGINNMNDLSGSNVIHHEGLHFVLDNFNTKELQALSKGVLDNLKNSNDTTLQRVGSILERRLKAYKTRGYGLNTKIGQQEFFTSLSDALRNIEAEQVALDPVAVRALRKVKRLFAEKFKDYLPNRTELDFNKMTEEDLLSFMIKYNAFNGTSEFAGLGTLKLPARKSKEIEDGVEEELNGFSIVLSDQVQEIYKGKGIEGAMDIINLYKPMARKIANKYSGVPDFDINKDILIEEILTGRRGVLDLMMAYNPESKVPLAAYINKYLKSRAIEAANRVLGEKFTIDVTEARGVVAEETVQEQVVTKESLRKKLNIEKDGTLYNKIKQAVVKTFGIRLPQVGTKAFKKSLQDNFRTELFKTIKKSIGTRGNYINFVTSNAKVIYDALPQSTLNKRFKQFAVPVLDKDGKQLREKTPQGNAIFNKKPFNQQEFVDYFLSDKLGASTRGTRKDALSEALAEELAFDATMEVIQDESVANRFNTVNEIQGFILPDNYLAQISKDIDRGVDSAFSIAIQSLPSDLSSQFNLYRENFFNNINELGMTKPAIRRALNDAYGKGFFGTYINGIINDFYKNLKNFNLAQEQYKKTNREFPGTIEEYINSVDNQMDDYLSISNYFGLKEGMAAIFRDERHVQNQRQYIGGELVNFLASKYGTRKTIELLYTNRAAFENGTGRGKRAMIYDNKADFINMLNSIDSAFNVTSIRGGITINGQEFKPKTVNEKVTKSHLNETENIELGEIKAKEAQQFLKDTFEFMSSEREGYTKINQAMTVAGLLGNMKTPLRAAAAYRYISTVKPSKNPKDYRYEHIIPARVVAFYMAESYLKNNKDVDINTLLNDYSVAIIPISMDNIIGKYFGSTMTIDYEIGMHPSKRYYNMFTKGEVQFAIKDIRDGKVYGQGYVEIYNTVQQMKKDNASFSIVVREDQTIQEQVQTFQNMQAALDVARDPNSPIKGISVFDFDDTLAQTNSQVIVNMPDGSVIKINATEFALQSADLEAAGAVFNFREFNEVIEGRKGPLFDLATRRQDKFTSKDIFILTARPQEAAYAIHAFLKGIGLNIPMNNIVGLADGKPEAKADWILGKAAQGYNNFYFADDAIKNVKAVRDVLNVIDVKNKVEQAGAFSISLESEMNQIIEDESGVSSWKTFSRAAAKQMGAKRRSKFKFFIPPSAEDFVGLLYDLLSKGAKGEKQMAFFDKHLLKPFAKAYRDLNHAKETISNDFRGLKRIYKDVRKKLTKSSGYRNFTYDQAIRVYIWNKIGMTIPGISKTDQKKLVSIVKKDQRMVEFADNLMNITKLKEGYVDPQQEWLGGSIARDISDVVDRVGRKKFLKQWVENKNQIFSEDVLNKIEAIYGTAYADALKDILYRMENGTNRSQGNSKVVNSFMNWVNNSVGAIMFFNMRSALLQTISAVNFINWSDNNILKAGLAFANQKQYWSDFTMLFNSPTLRQRRKGLQKDVNEAEIANAAANSRNKAQAILAYLLKIGFTPTQIADSFAIASGGATFYRNRVNTYLKQGVSKKQAESRAFDDFLEASEKAQQSSRPDLISPIQAGPLGRLIFAFQNTPMQYTRIIKKSMRDIANGRGDFKTNLSKILYYGAIQNIIFTGLQNAMFGQLFEDDDDEEVEEKYAKKKTRMLNNMVDTFLRGSGLAGAIVSTTKNAIMKFMEQEQKGWNSDHTYTMIELTNLSPPIGSKLRKIYSGIQTYRFNKKIIPQMGFDIDNPAWSGFGSVVSGVTNFPLDRMLHLIESVREATDQNNAAWQRIALLLGWRTWDVGAENEEVEAIKKQSKKNPFKNPDKFKKKNMFKKK